MDWSKFDAEITAQYGDKLPMALRIRHMVLAAIAARALLPGTRIIETELGHQLQVSRTPLREAMAGLKADGILRHDDDGIRIRQLDWSAVTNLYEMRATLEGMAARQAAQRASHAEKNVINAIHQDETQMISQGANPDQLAKINMRFHASILAAAGNPFLTESFDRLSRLLILLGVTAYTLPSRVRDITKEHQSINAAIQSSNLETAEEAMKIHLMHGLEARLQLMAELNISDLD
jgi:DNA-binding GntR family transcriptional regulator